MIRVVTDTNILISALLQPQGLPAQVLLVTIAGPTARLCVSGEDKSRCAMSSLFLGSAYILHYAFT